MIGWLTGDMYVNGLDRLGCFLTWMVQRVEKHVLDGSVEHRVELEQI